jgi:hypothetical protein
METNIEWLDLSRTNNRSYNDIVSSLPSEFEGWRLPSTNEVTDMFTRFFSGVTLPINGFGDYQSGSEGHTSATSWRELLSEPSNVFTYGMFKNDGMVKSIGTFFYGNAVRIMNLNSAPFFPLDNVAAIQYSTFLVRNATLTTPTPVEEEDTPTSTGPSSTVNVSTPMSLSALVLASLMLLRRKKVTDI